MMREPVIHRIGSGERTLNMTIQAGALNILHRFQRGGRTPRPSGPAVECRASPRSGRVPCRLFILVAVCTALWCLDVVAADSLPPLNADLSETSVSGVSSGGYMAVQFHVA